MVELKCLMLLNSVIIVPVHNFVLQHSLVYLNIIVFHYYSLYIMIIDRSGYMGQFIYIYLVLKKSYGISIFLFLEFLMLNLSLGIFDC